MKLNGNTILITGGGSGIGRGLAEALHNLGNKVIISGRRQAQLDAVIAANPGIEAVTLDVADPKSITQVATKLIADHPKLNVLINNAGIMLQDDVSGAVDEKVLVSQIETNLIGAIRLSSALVEHLKQQKDATIVYNSSVLAYVPLGPFAVYSATKAAVHSYALAQRFQLRNTSVKVQEIVPPYVATDLLGTPDDPRAMPLGAFIEGTIAALGTDADEVLVEEAKGLRNSAGPNEHIAVKELNSHWASH